MRNSEKFTFFLLPEFILGVPRYDMAECTSFVMEKLIDNGFMVKYTHPNLLVISWIHLKERFPDLIDEWKEFKDFFKDVGWRPSEEHFLTRKNHQEPIGPKNHIWTTHEENSNNRINDGLADDLGFCIDGPVLDSRPNQTDQTREGVPRRTVRQNTEERVRVASAR